MMTLYSYEELGRAQFGWLDARHHFSFGNYYNPERMGFGTLRVINDDIIKAGKGFGMHPHNDMEIITFVRKGAITHKDSRGNQGVTRAGDMQVMSAGKGIFHSEYNLESEDTNIFQIWIEPKEEGIEPRWDASNFSKREASETLPLLVSGRDTDKDKGALYIHADASISGGQLRQGQSLTHTLYDQGYLLVSEGEIEVKGRTLQKGDGLEIVDEKDVSLTALSDAEVIVIDVPPR